MKGFFDVVESREGYIDQYGMQHNSKKVKLTAAQILLLHTTPQTLITSPGPDKFILIDNAVAYLDYSGGAFAGSNDLEIRAVDGSGTLLVEDGFASGFLNGVADAIAVEAGVAYWGEVTRVLDQAVVAVVPVADPTGALSTSTLSIILNYTIIKVHN